MFDTIAPMANKRTMRLIGWSIVAAAASVLGVSTVLLADMATIPEPYRLGALYAAIFSILILCVAMAQKIAANWVARKPHLAGAMLYRRLILVFGVLTITPAFIVAALSVLSLHLGTERWFSDRVRIAVTESRIIAGAYLEEHRQAIRSAALEMAFDFYRTPQLLRGSGQPLLEFAARHRQRHGLSDVAVMSDQGKVLARSGLGVSSALSQVVIPKTAWDRAKRGEIAVIRTERNDLVHALVRVDRLFRVYLYVSRYVDPHVTARVERTVSAANEYDGLLATQQRLLWISAGLFGTMAVMLLLGAMTGGAIFATKMFQPISALIAASSRVRDGDLSVRVPENDRKDELGVLVRTFNGMVVRQDEQRAELLTAHTELNERHRFINTVLADLSAGVIELDPGGVIRLMNRGAEERLSVSAVDFLGRHVTGLLAKADELIAEASCYPDRVAESQIEIFDAGRQKRTLLVRVGAEGVEQGQHTGFVVSFDDITELLSAQRQAAWSHIARRIAHEIRNPLTPIQLSAERILGKYSGQIKTERDVFEQCCATILRQVGDLRRMVEEFSTYARMPLPEPAWRDLTMVCDSALFIQREAQTDIDWLFTAHTASLFAHCDARQIEQALSNLLRNAAQSIEERRQMLAEPDYRGVVEVVASADDSYITLTVRDNGQGLPRNITDALTEPYVTTKQKGSGLGLAICKKILEDHRGNLLLSDREDGSGACVVLRLPRGENPPRPEQ